MPAKRRATRPAVGPADRSADLGAVAAPLAVATLRVLSKLAKVAAVAALGYAAAALVLRGMTGSSDMPAVGALLLVVFAAGVGFGGGIAVSYLAENLAEQTALRAATQIRPLSEPEWEAERLRELPRLAREAGPALAEINEVNDRPKSERPTAAP